MAGNTNGTCSSAAPISQPANTACRAKQAAEPAVKPGKHKRNTTGPREDHERTTRTSAVGYPPAIPWHLLGLCLARNWPVPHLSLPLVGLQPSGLGFLPARRPINHQPSTINSSSYQLTTAFCLRWLLDLGYRLLALGCRMLDVAVCGPPSNPKGIPSQSPGLRAASYPGSAVRDSASTPTGLRPPRAQSKASTRSGLTAAPLSSSAAA